MLVGYFSEARRQCRLRATTARRIVGLQTRSRERPVAASELPRKRADGTWRRRYGEVRYGTVRYGPVRFLTRKVSPPRVGAHPGWASVGHRATWRLSIEDCVLAVARRRPCVAHLGRADGPEQAGRSNARAPQLLRCRGAPTTSRPWSRCRSPLRRRPRGTKGAPEWVEHAPNFRTHPRARNSNLC